MNAWINVCAFDIESIGRNLNIFLRWKNAVLQMPETWFSIESASFANWYVSSGRKEI